MLFSLFMPFALMPHSASLIKHIFLFLLLLLVGLLVVFGLALHRGGVHLLLDVAHVEEAAKEDEVAGVHEQGHPDVAVRDVALETALKIKIRHKLKVDPSRSGWLSGLRRCLPRRWAWFDPRAWPDLQLVWKSTAIEIIDRLKNCSSNSKGCSRILRHGSA
jgi:hypothetical protein